MQRNFSEDGGGMFRFYMQLEDCTTSQLTWPEFSRRCLLDVKYGRQRCYGKTLAASQLCSVCVQSCESFCKLRKGARRQEYFLQDYNW
jgi:hypothetical protein